MIKKVLAGFLALSITAGVSAFATTLPNTVYLKKGYKNSTVTSLQQRLKELGYFKVSPTGYFGNVTRSAVKSFQSENGLAADGIAGKNTISALNAIPVIGSTEESAKATTTTSTESDYNTNTLDWTWFGNVKSFMPNGSTFEILDINSGKRIKLKRTYGTNHADSETLTTGDTSTLKSVIGGSWTWTRRPIVVFYNGYAIPASMAPYPHAGNDKAPATAYTSWRSGNYGGGANLDAVKKNNMNGVVDIHFLKSKTHGSNRVEPMHQATVKKAAQYISKNLK